MRDRWFEGGKRAVVARGRTEPGLRENRENVEESLLSSAIRLPCKRAVYVAGDLVA